MLARAIEVRTTSEIAKLQGAKSPNTPTESPNVVLQDATPHLLNRLPLRTDWNRIQKQERDQCQKSRKVGQWLRMEILL
jgi:hypothetical protein